MEGVVFVLLSLADAYLTRGSPREAEYFLKQVQTLGESAGLPAVESRALTRMVEVQLGIGRLEDAAKLLEEAAAKLGERVALDNVDLQRLLARYSERAEDHATSAELSLRALRLLQQLNGDFQRMDGYVMGYVRRYEWGDYLLIMLLARLRRSLEGQAAGGDTIAPDLAAAVLSRYSECCLGSFPENDHSGLPQYGYLEKAAIKTSMGCSRRCAPYLPPSGLRYIRTYVRRLELMLLSRLRRIR
jgi:separase